MVVVIVDRPYIWCIIRLALSEEGAVNRTAGRRIMAHKKTTGNAAASAVGRVLSDPKSTKAEKAAAASALSQTTGKKH